MAGTRIYKYDNAKALLIYLVVVGHITTDYVSDSHIIRSITLWIYLFHMPAFMFISGLMHKRYLLDGVDYSSGSKGLFSVAGGETSFRSDKALGFFLCAYALKILLQFSRTWMGQNPVWYWIDEPGIPWYLFVLAEYEIFFFIIRRVDARLRPQIMIAFALLASMIVGYFPNVDETFCLSRAINFLPIYALGYYMDKDSFAAFIDRKSFKIGGLLILIAAFITCYLGPWNIYSWRMWFTGRRSYEYLSGAFPFALQYGAAVRVAVWIVAMILAFALLALMPNRQLGFLTLIGSRSLQVYFWHRPVGYFFRDIRLLPKLIEAFGGTYSHSLLGSGDAMAFGGGVFPMLLGLSAYLLIAAALTALFSLKVFEQPCLALMTLSRKITRRS